MRKQGFTIIELIVAIVVIGILASITVVAYNGTQARARDSRRISDLQNISDAIKLYRSKNGNDIQTGSGCGSSGNGDGWFNFSDGSTYPASTLSCLTSQGYLDNNHVDPSGCTSNAGACATKGAYMKYTCGTGASAITYLYARMETTDNSAQLKTPNDVCNSNFVATTYSMNYEVVVN